MSEESLLSEGHENKKHRQPTEQADRAFSLLSYPQEDHEIILLLPHYHIGLKP
jgi:hypothetical protein